MLLHHCIVRVEVQASYLTSFDIEKGRISFFVLGEVGNLAFLEASTETTLAGRVRDAKILLPMCPLLTPQVLVSLMLGSNESPDSP